MLSILVGRMEKVKGLLVSRGTESQEMIISKSQVSFLQVNKRSRCTYKTLFSWEEPALTTDVANRVTFTRSVSHIGSWHNWVWHRGDILWSYIKYLGCLKTPVSCMISQDVGKYQRSERVGDNSVTNLLTTLHTLEAHHTSFQRLRGSTQ